MDELLRAVIEAPDDDAPRLVYADALMRAGDLRGEFIALQLASNPAATARATELLAEHRATWIAALPHVHDAYFERGFASAASLRCDRADTPVLAALDREPIRSVALVCDDLDDDPQIDHVAVAHWFAADARTSRLRSLDLARAAHEGWGEAAFSILLGADLRNLRELHVGDFDCVAHGVRAITALTNKLTTLAFHGDYHASLHECIDELVTSPVVSELEALILTDCGLPAHGGIAVAHAQLTKLRHLSFSGGSYQANRIEDEGAIALAESTTLPALATLQLVNNQVTDNFLEALVPPSALPALTNLAVNSCEGITSRGFSSLVRSPRFATMEQLWVGGCRIDDAGLIALATSPFAHALRTINLFGNPITAAGARALAESPLAAQLEILAIDEALEPILRPAFGARLNPGP